MLNTQEKWVLLQNNFNLHFLKVERSKGGYLLISYPWDFLDHFVVFFKKSWRCTICCKDASSRSNSGPTEFNEKPLEPFSLGNSENAQKFQVLERSKACGHRSIVEIQRTTTCTWNSWRRSWGRNWKTSPWIRAFLLWPDQRKLWPLALLPRWDDERNDCNFLIQNSMRKEGMYDWPFFHAGAKFHSFWQQNARNNKH